MKRGDRVRSQAEDRESKERETKEKREVGFE